MAAQAQTLPPPQNVLNLSATASVEVTKDWLAVVFSTSREGTDAATVQTQLKQALDAALTEARKGARPGQLEVQTGAFSLYPRYAPPTSPVPAASGKAAMPGQPGGIVAWQGNTELIVEGRDAAAIAQLTGRIRTLSIARVGWSLSREARRQFEGDVAAQAIERFRAQADTMSRLFGFAGWTVREVSVASDSPVVAMQQPLLMRAQAARMPGDDALPVEAGKATVNASVSGSVQMK